MWRLKSTDHTWLKINQPMWKVKLANYSKQGLNQRVILAERLVNQLGLHQPSVFKRLVLYYCNFRLCMLYSYLFSVLILPLVATKLFSFSL